MFRLPAALPMIAVCLCFIQNPINADEEDYKRRLGGPYSPTAEELKMLPAACIAKENRNPAEVEKWEKALGDSFVHLHHYCYALNFLNRIHRGIGDKKFLLNAALNDFKYMQRISEHNVLRPELEYNTGQVLYQLGKMPEAVASLQKAIVLKPDYVQAYLLLSLCYRKVGDITGAAEVLQAGLTKVPDSSSLQNALREINSTKQESNADKH